MIREFKENDINEIMKISLDVNVEIHSFIEKKYWQKNYDEVKKALFYANVYVYIDNNKIIGFVGLIGNYIIVFLY